MAAPAMIGTAKAQTRELRMGTPFVNGSNLHQAMQKFAEVVNSAVERASSRSLSTPTARSATSRQLLSGMQLGTIDMAYLGIGNGAALKGGGPLNVAYTPYLFKSKEWAEKIINGPIFAPMFEDLAKESGVRVFAAAGARSGRAIQTIKGPINEPDDLKGFRLRIPPIPMFKDAFEALGVKVVPMGLSDVYLALRADRSTARTTASTCRCRSSGTKWRSSGRRPTTATSSRPGTCRTSCGSSSTPTIARCSSAPPRKAAWSRRALGEQIDAGGIEELKKAGVDLCQARPRAFRKAFANAHKPYEGKQWPAGLVDQIRQMQS